MTVNEIRSKFLNYMKEKGHAVVLSASLVPENDPTTLFTGSGMQPMLPYLLGQSHPLGKRIADSQRCFRTQDIEEVGDNRHTTFFEMLGNWSFGDYFKEEEITWMWTFLIDELGLDPKNFYVTCFAGNDALGVPRDTFSAEMWQKLFATKGIEAKISDTPEAGMKESERIFYYGEKKNWWSRSGVPANMPEGEPGGPDSEMFYDFDPKNEKKIHEMSLYKETPCHVNCDCGRFMELGNNVFMQYRKVGTGFEELPQMNVDHGSGLERYAAALRNDPDVFNVDVFDEAKKIIENCSGKKYGSDEKTTYAMRVILDHTRAAVFLIGDGVLPGNKDQMYFVRRLIRRALRYVRFLSLSTNLTSLAETFIEKYKKDCPGLLEQKEFILTELGKEENKTVETIQKGYNEFRRRLVKNGKITAKDVFDLYQSFGLSKDQTKETIEELSEMTKSSVEHSVIPEPNAIDWNEVEKLIVEHKEQSRTASAGKFKGGLGGDGEMETKYHTATHLLHEALRQVLGEHVLQKGSNITAERLRFDFSHGEKMTDEQKAQVEKIVNDVIAQDLPVVREEVSYEEARARGAIGVFDVKYGDTVSIYTVGEPGKRGEANLFSMEFCGGPHVESTGKLAVGTRDAHDSSQGHNHSTSLAGSSQSDKERKLKFKIVKEEAVSAGVRRIKAVLD